MTGFSVGFNNLYNYQTNSGNNFTQSSDSFYNGGASSAITPELQGVFDSINALVQQTQTSMSQIQQNQQTPQNQQNNTTGQNLNIMNPYDQVGMVTESIRQFTGNIAANNNAMQANNNTMQANGNTVQANNNTMQVNNNTMQANNNAVHANNQKAKSAAVALYDAMEGAGTDEKTVFDLLENMSPEERAETEKAYAMMFGQGDLSQLRKDLRDEFTGSDETRAFKALNNGLSRADSVVAANALKEAMEGTGTDDMTVHQIFDGASKNELNTIENVFDSLENKPGALRSWIRGDFSGTEQESLLGQLNQAII